MATTKSTAKKPAKAAAASKSAAPAKKKPAGSGKTAAGETPNYTKPELRERLKDQIKAGDKGGKPGQWSARKAQLLASEYEKQGGGYKKAARTSGQKHLKQWTDEKWQTADGSKAAHGKTMSRYLPKAAWEKLTPEQREATDEKKKNASRTGKQFVANTPAAKRARKSATAS